MNATLKWKLVAGFVLAFLAGAAAGGFFAARESRHLRSDFSPHRPSLAERMRSRMETKLDLTPVQIEKAAPIFDRTATELEKIRTETGRRVREVMAEANQALRSELTEEQQAKLDAMEKQVRSGHEFRKSKRRRAASP